MRKRIVTDDLFNRVHSAEKTIHDWMTSTNKVETTPEECMDILVENLIYEYDSNGRGHHFREDLRTLRDNNLLATFNKFVVKQMKPGAPWYIEIGK